MLFASNLGKDRIKNYQKTFFFFYNTFYEQFYNSLPFRNML